MSVYIEYSFSVDPPEMGVEILIAQLGYAGFESFVEQDQGVLAYIQKADWYETILDNIQILESSEFKITFQQKEIDQVNWNAEWEKNFDPIVVNATCAVRAPFHPPYNCTYEIVIEPKMSFGTGHHETTFMMMEFILENEFKNKTVLDMGCGTAVLGILAEMRGAKAIDAIDIDTWCVENSQENVMRNSCKTIEVILGDASVIPENKYDIVIANINRNILLNDMPIYREAFKNSGELYLSGFYKEDLSVLKSCCNKLGFTFVENKERNRWVCAKFTV